MRSTPLVNHTPSQYHTLCSTIPSSLPLSKDQLNIPIHDLVLHSLPNIYILLGISLNRKLVKVSS